MPQIDEPTSPGPKTAVAEGRKPKAAPGPKPGAELFSITIDAANGHVVAVERVDDVGARHPLSAEDKTRFARMQTSAPLRHVVEQAFEAGIECILGNGDKEPAESKSEGELSRMLLHSLLESSGVKKLIEGEKLNKAIVGTLIVQAAKP